MAVKKDAKSEFIDAYKKMFSKEQLKDMGQFVADEAKKPGNQAVLAVAPMGKIPKIAKGAKAVGKIAKGLKTAGKAVAKAVGVGKPKSLAKSYDPSIPFKPDYKPPKTDIAESRGGRDYLTPAADRRIRQQEASDWGKSMQKKRKDELDAELKSIRTDPRYSVNQKERLTEQLIRAYKKENRGREY